MTLGLYASATTCALLLVTSFPNIALMLKDEDMLTKTSRFSETKSRCLTPFETEDKQADWIVRTSIGAG